MALFQASPMVCVEWMNDLKISVAPTARPRPAKAFIMPPMADLKTLDTESVSF